MIISSLDVKGIQIYYSLSAFSILLSYSVALEKTEMGYFITKDQPEMTVIHVMQGLGNCQRKFPLIMGSYQYMTASERKQEFCRFFSVFLV